MSHEKLFPHRRELFRLTRCQSWTGRHSESLCLGHVALQPEVPWQS